MKITKAQLKRIIKEELLKMSQDNRWGKPRKNIKRRDPRYFLDEVDIMGDAGLASGSPHDTSAVKTGLGAGEGHTGLEQQLMEDPVLAILDLLSTAFGTMAIALEEGHGTEGADHWMGQMDKTMQGVLLAKDLAKAGSIDLPHRGTQGVIPPYLDEIILAYDDWKKQGPKTSDPNISAANAQRFKRISDELSDMHTKEEKGSSIGRKIGQATGMPGTFSEQKRRTSRPSKTTNSELKRIIREELKKMR